MNTPANSGYSELKYGAGQLNLSKARDPGLVYDASDATQLAIITGSNATSTWDGAAVPTASDLNYPTMAAHVAPGENFTVSFTRTVTNAGASPDAVYVANIFSSASGLVSQLLFRRTGWSSAARTRRPSLVCPCPARGWQRMRSFRRPSCGLRASTK